MKQKSFPIAGARSQKNYLGDEFGQQAFVLKDEESGRFFISANGRDPLPLGNGCWGFKNTEEIRNADKALSHWGVQVSLQTLEALG